MDIEKVAQMANLIVDEVETVIVGKRKTIELILVALLAGGHVLVEDIPGVGKTTLAKAFAKSIGCSFKRIQFTPDLLPADIIGVSVFNQKTSDFEFRKGPVFASIVLADEINRATPKTQSSLLECMEEFQATVDGITYEMPKPFLVIATENPVEYRGTHPLPESQLDRFLMCLDVGYPDKQEEIVIIDRQSEEHPIKKVKPVVDTPDIIFLQEAVKEVFVEDTIKDYIVEIINSSRTHPQVALGSSPRGSLALFRCSRALAAIRGCDFVVPDDVKSLAAAILGHRIVLKPETKLRGIRAQEVVDEILKTIDVPIAPNRGAS